MVAVLRSFFRLAVVFSLAYLKLFSNAAPEVILTTPVFDAPEPIVLRLIE